MGELGGMIIGLAGRAGAGKNTVADCLCELMPGARQIAFADPLRRIAADLYGLHPHQLTDRDAKEAVIPQWGLSPRQILQRLGTEVGRQIHPETWTRYLERQVRAEPGVEWIVTDVRMPNEVDTIERLGGVVWWVERPGAGTRHAHATESELNPHDFSYSVANDGDLSDLRRAVAEELNELLDYACTA